MTKKQGIAILGLAVAAFFLYLPSANFDFINFDEHTVLLAHPQLYDETSFLSSLNHILFKSFPREEPLILRDITWAADSYFYGFENPFGYHLGNIILNTFNVLLLFVFLNLTTGRFLMSFAVSAFFAALPVHVEPVCWVMGRKDVLVTFFMFLGLIVQTLYLQASDSRKRRIFYLTGILIVSAALLSKINAVTFFAVLMAHQVFYPYIHGDYPPNHPIRLRSIFSDILPRFLPHLVITLMIYFWYKGIISQWGVLDRGVDNGSFNHLKTLLLFIPLVMGISFKLILIPFGYSILYEFPSIHEPLSRFDIAYSVLIGISIIVITIFLFIKRKDLLFYWLAFFLLMIPYMNIIYIGIWVANRYIYFSSFCILVILAETAKYLIHQNLLMKKVIIFAATAYLCLNIVQTWRYEQVWKSDSEIWKYEVSLQSPSLMAISSMANSYIIAAKKTVDTQEKKELYIQADILLEKGFEQFKNSGRLQTTPYLFRLYYLKGLMTPFLIQGEHYEAQMAYYAKAYELKPDNKDIVRKMAEMYYRRAVASDNADDKRHDAEISVSFFKKYITLMQKEFQTDPSILPILRSYETHFPFLTDNIAALRREISEKSNP